MGIKYSDLPLEYEIGIRSDTSAHLRQDLDDVLQAVGWAPVNITDGKKYTVTSPQSLICKCKIWDTGAVDFLGRHYITVQFLSEDETKEGHAHQLVYGPTEYSTLGYQIIAGKSQMFVSIPNVSTEQLILGTFAYSVAGGIPFIAAPVDPECTADALPGTVARMFWSSGSGSAPFSIYPNFRNSRFSYEAYSHLLNDNLFSATGSQAVDPASGGELCLFPLTPTNNIDAPLFVPPRVVKYSTGLPLYTDAFIGWEWQIRGQLYDAFLASRDVTLDSKIFTTEEDDDGTIRTDQWIAWNYAVPAADKGGSGTYFGTLYLLIGSTGEAHNVAY